MIFQNKRHMSIGILQLFYGNSFFSICPSSETHCLIFTHSAPRVIRTHPALRHLHSQTRNSENSINSRVSQRISVFPSFLLYFFFSSLLCFALFLRLIYFYFACMSVACMCPQCAMCPQCRGSQKMALDPRELELQMVWAAMSVVETKPKFS